MIKKRTLAFILYDFCVVFTFINILHLLNGSFPQLSVTFNLEISSLLILLYAFSGSYDQIIRKSRFKEFVRTFNQSIILGVVFFIFHFLINNLPTSGDAIINLFYLVFYHFAILFIFRLFYLTGIKRLLQRRIIGFKTLIIGQNKKALEIYHEINQQKKSLGFKFEGFIALDDKSSSKFGIEDLKFLGKTEDLTKIISEKGIEEVIIAIETSQHPKLKEILDKLERSKVVINIIPDIYDILTGFVKINYLFSIPLITLHSDPMPIWQRLVKKVFDYIMSLLVILIFSPVFILISLAVKLSSKGPIIFKQERVGKHGKSFKIFKFRTMYNDAEVNGPQLSSKDDSRITPIGLWLRKLRLDELPQFINVLKGEMSIVGPRPERQFYINQIIEKAPHYHYLQKVLPGITSWGQVKFGYAENIEQMINRLTFDIIYIENRSLSLDFKIMIYTFITILQRRGK